MKNNNPPRLYVDFNEMVEPNLVLLSQKDIKVDSAGNEIELFEGKNVSIYMDDIDEFGNRDDLLADGTVERNDPEQNGNWTKAAKWCCRINERGIYNESDDT